MIEAQIFECGNGFPKIGELLYDPESNMVYKLVHTSGYIHTHAPGIGNSIFGTVEEECDASDLTEDEWDKIEDNNYRIVVQ